VRDDLVPRTAPPVTRLTEEARDREFRRYAQLWKSKRQHSGAPIEVLPGPGERPRTLLEFTRRFQPFYRPGALHRYVASEIQQALEDRQWLILSVPPQHGKSELVSVNAPAWYLGGYPDHRWVQASYGESLAAKHSRRARQIVREPEFRSMYGVGLSLETNSATEWDIAGHRGGLYAVGIGGGLTGRGADVIVIDDPVKNRAEAESDVIREGHWDWWTGTARTRLQPGGVVILVMTRWHHDDLAGRLLKQSDQDRDKWRVVNIPARAEDDDPLGRAAGEVVWPERFETPEAAERFYDELQRDMGPRDWTALAQGHPTMSADAIFKPEFWGWYEPEQLPKGWLWVIQYWDTAFKEGTRNDYNACVTLGVSGTQAYVLEVFRKRMEMPELLMVAKAQRARWQPTHLAVENKASGPSLAQLLRQQTGQHVELWDSPDGGDKVARAYSIQPILANEQVLLPRGTLPWMPDFLDELYQFASGAHDDQVDAFVGALQKVKSMWDGGKRLKITSSYASGTGNGRIVPEGYIDTDTGRAPSPELVARRD
jgi:predicted phage terminase large subunit-like protein